MDPPPPTSFSGRRRSSIISLDPSTPAVTTPAVAPRKSSILDEDNHAKALGPTASNISARKASAADPTAPPTDHGTPSLIAGRKASTWNDDAGGSGGSRGSASDIASRRATALDRPPWDSFAGAPPGYADSTWDWVTEIWNITSITSTSDERNRAFYSGNVDYILQLHSEKSLDIEDMKVIMHAYGIDETNIEDIVTRIDPGKHGSFYLNSSMHHIMLPSDTNFSDPVKDPLTNLRHASNCFQKNLLSPIHYAGYIIDTLKRGGLIGNEPRFMILGLYGILGLLENWNDPTVASKNVETFIGFWRVLKPDEARDLIELINDSFDSNFSPWSFYNILYRRNVFGKQRIEMFDLESPQDPRFMFILMDKDEDGCISSSDLLRFAAMVGRSLTNDETRSLINKLDFDGDGMINFEDFRRTIMPIYDGMTWEFWLAATLFKLEL